MGKEGKARTNLSWSKNDRRVDYNKSYFFDTSGDNYLETIQNVGTTNEALDVLDSGTEGFCILENLNTTYTLYYGASQSYTHKVPPGQNNTIWCNSALYGSTNSNCDIKIVLLEE